MLSAVTLRLVLAASISLVWPASAAEPLCAGADLQSAQTALPAARAMVDQAIAAIDNPTADDLNRLQTWFGVNSSSGAQSVRQRLVSSRAFMDGVTYRCSVNTNATLGDYFGYVQPDKSFAVVLGAFFFSASDTGFDSKPGVFIHEMSHFVLAGATKDTAYGVDGAKTLAAANPMAAQRNADNYEYFVEATSFGLN